MLRNFIVGGGFPSWQRVHRLCSRHDRCPAGCHSSSRRCSASHCRSARHCGKRRSAWNPTTAAAVPRRRSRSSSRPETSRTANVECAASVPVRVRSQARKPDVQDPTRLVRTMTSQNIPVVDLGDWHEGGAARVRFVATVGESLADIGFFAVQNHGIPDALIARAYDVAQGVLSPAAATSSSAITTPRRRVSAASPASASEHAKDAKAPTSRSSGRSAGRAANAPAVRRQPRAAEVPGLRRRRSPSCIEQLDDARRAAARARAPRTSTSPPIAFADMAQRQRHDRACPLLPARRRRRARRCGALRGARGHQPHHAALGRDRRGPRAASAATARGCRCTPGSTRSSSTPATCCRT